jgi:hypothetical protein
MKRFPSAALLGLLAVLCAGPALAQMDGIGSGGLGDAKAQNEPSSVGINNGIRAQAPAGGYSSPGLGAGEAVRPDVRGARSSYASRHRRKHARRI